MNGKDLFLSYQTIAHHKLFNSKPGHDKVYFPVVVRDKEKGEYYVTALFGPRVTYLKKAASGLTIAPMTKCSSLSRAMDLGDEMAMAKIDAKGYTMHPDGVTFEPLIERMWMKLKQDNLAVFNEETEQRSRGLAPKRRTPILDTHAETQAPVVTITRRRRSIGF